MEEYEEMENNAFDAFDASATTTTPEGHQHETLSQTRQIMHEGGVELEGNQLGNVGTLRATSGNATKRLKSRGPENPQRRQTRNLQPKSFKWKRIRCEVGKKM